jgi:acetyl-CoA carboxylase carboxyl transferase subunit alpha
MAAELDFERPLRDLRAELEQARKLRNGKSDVEDGADLSLLEEKLEQHTAEVFANLTPWQKVQLARHAQRPRFLDYVHILFTDYVELHGDRHFGDDPALLGGLATFEGRSVVVIGQQKGRNTKENVERNFGMAHPEGYRKALRLMRLADKFGLPLMCFADTSGASPALVDEERGQAWSIAENLYAMAELRVPILVTILGEGGSGGALGIAIGDSVLMLEYAIYSVASPETCASITMRDAAYAPEAAAAMRVTAPALLELGLIDTIVREPSGGAHQNPEHAALLLRGALRHEMAALEGKGLTTDQLLDRRYERYRAMGRYAEVATA